MIKKRSFGLILSYSNTILSMICGLFLSSFLLRRLGDTEYGVYQTMSSFANYLVLLEFGAGSIMARNISSCRAKENNEHEIEKNISTIWSITAFLAVIIVLVSIVFYFSIDKIYVKSMTPAEISLGKKMFFFIVLFLLVSFAQQTLNGIALSFEDYSFAAKNNIIKLIIRTILLFVLVLKLKSAIVIVIVDAVIGSVLALYSYFYCKKRFRVNINFKSFDLKIMKMSLPLCLAIFMQGIINQANSNVGKFILGIKIGPEEVALYSVAMYIYSIFSSLSTIPISLYVPQVTKNVAEGYEAEQLSKSLIVPSRLIYLVSGTICFGFIAAGKPFINIVYGTEYMQAWIIAVLIMLPMFFYSSTAICLNVLDAKNKRMGASVVLLFTTAINICLTLFLSEKMGIIGVAMATSISTVIGQIIALDIYYFKSVKINALFLMWQASKGIFPYQIIGAALGLLLSTSISNTYIAFLVSGGVYVLIAFGGFLLFGKSETEAKAIQGLITKMKNK